MQQQYGDTAEAKGPEHALPRLILRTVDDISSNFSALGNIRADKRSASTPKILIPKKMNELLHLPEATTRQTHILSLRKLSKGDR